MIIQFLKEMSVHYILNSFIRYMYLLRSIDHFTVKVTQYSRGQTFEFYDSQKGDNEMFLMIFL